MPFRIIIQCNNATQIFCPCFPSSKDQQTRTWNSSSLIRSAGIRSTPLTHCFESVWHFDKNFEFTCITMFLAGCYDGLYYSLGHYVCPPGSFTVIWAQPGSHRRAINEQRNVIVCVWPYTNFLLVNKTWGICAIHAWNTPGHIQSLCISILICVYHKPWPCFSSTRNKFQHLLIDILFYFICSLSKAASLCSMLSSRDKQLTFSMTHSTLISTEYFTVLFFIAVNLISGGSLT